MNREEVRKKLGTTEFLFSFSGNDICEVKGYEQISMDKRGTIARV